MHVHIRIVHCFLPVQGAPLTADNRGLGSAILFHETSGIGPEPMAFGDGIAVTHPGATNAKVSLTAALS